MIVAVSQRIDIIYERSERRDTLDQRLCIWLSNAGFLPVPIPNVLAGCDENDQSKLLTWLSTVKPHAIILSGGNNIGEEPDRDETEHQILSWAWDHKRPVLGICRGMQMMGNWGGILLKPVDGHVDTRHVLHGVLSGEVNSFHNFSLVECPSGFEVLARSEDNEIEAIRSHYLPWEGWMWHPEREEFCSPRDIIRLRELFSVQ